MIEKVLTALGLGCSGTIAAFNAANGNCLNSPWAWMFRNRAYLEEYIAPPVLTALGLGCSGTDEKDYFLEKKSVLTALGLGCSGTDIGVRILNISRLNSPWAWVFRNTIPSSV